MARNPEASQDIRLIRINSEIQSQLLDFLNSETAEDFSSIEQGLRFSPKAIRSLILMTAGKLYESHDFSTPHEVPNQNIFANNLILYGLSLGFISNFERKLLNLGVPYLINLSKNKEDQYLKDHPQLNSRILPDFANLDRAVKEEKSIDSRKRTVLFHGKWNVPHLGHMAFIHDSLLTISLESSIPQSLLLPVMVCERNKYIKSVGKQPFMNTHWRLSLMSYIPQVKYLLPGDDIDASAASDYWSAFYRDFKPDFLPVEIGDEFTNKKIAAAQDAEISIVEIPTSLNNGAGKRLSSTNLINEGLISEADFANQYSQFEKLIGKSWRKKWF